jgi:hypothetical protein
MRNFMSKITDAAKNLFANQMPQTSSKTFPAPNQLAGLDAPGCAFKKPISIMPAVVAKTPAPVAEPRIEQPASIQHCHACGQTLPQQPVAEVVAVVEQVSTGPVDASDDRRPINIAEEERTDFPMRTSGRIQFLLKHYERTPEQTQARILNDGARYRYRRSRES